MFLNITIFNWNIIEKNKKMNKFVAFARTSWACFETPGFKDIFH